MRRVSRSLSTLAICLALVLPAAVSAQDGGADQTPTPRVFLPMVGGATGQADSAEALQADTAGEVTAAAVAPLTVANDPFTQADMQGVRRHQPQGQRGA